MHFGDNEILLVLVFPSKTNFTTESQKHVRQKKVFILRIDIKSSLGLSVTSKNSKDS
jgi:hypothetical protein